MVSAFEIARSVERLVLTTRAEAVAKDILIVAPVPVRECGSLAGVYAGAEARQAGLTSYLGRDGRTSGLWVLRCGLSDRGIAAGRGALWGGCACHAGTGPGAGGAGQVALKYAIARNRLSQIKLPKVGRATL